LRLTAGSDGRVQQVSLTFQQQDSGSAAGDGSYTWSVTYSQLGTTPPITAPATCATGVRQCQEGDSGSSLVSGAGP
jgi:phage head maturation protease